ncbi:MAG: glycosyltransferase family 2 protein [Candidatus Aenigmarchaeota archaeon]|nr:glycosyltransferase family 2 protein [Candidatus Aenigmarchaeota archaeon]
MKLVVMIPAFNEEESIRKVIRAIPRKIEGIDKVEILVIDDGSADDTAKAAKKAGASRIAVHRKNRGVGSAFNTGLENALEMGADIIINTDADGQFSAKDIPRLIEPILKEKTDVVIGSRFLGKNPEMPFMKKAGNLLFSWLTRKISGADLTDTQCGFRAFTREVALRTVLFGKFTYTQEFIIRAANGCFRITEIPIVAEKRKTGKSKVVKTWYLYGLKAISIVLRKYTDTHPILIFGALSLAVFIVALFPFAWAMFYYLQTGHFTGVLGSAMLAGFLFLTSLITLTFGILADMFVRQRILQEDILYRQKLERYGKR